MSNADPTELSVVVRSDGVNVEKSYEPDDFPVPAIAFVIRSEREEAVQIRLVDRVPEDVEAEDIGFHPKYGAEFWSVEEGNIVFEREFEGGEEYTTVYGLRASDTEDVRSYLSEPELENVDPPRSAGEDGDEGGVDPLDLSDPEEVATPSDDDIEAALADVDDATEPGATSEPDPDDTGIDLPGSGGSLNPESDPESGAGDLLDGPGGEAGRGDVYVDADEPGGAGRDVVGELAAALRDGSADADDVETLRNALNEGSGNSVDARIKQLQTDIADLRSYTSALESFLDEEGEGQQLLDELQESVSEIQGEVATVAGRAEENAQRIGRVDSDLASVDDDLESISGTVETLEDSVSGLESDVAAVTDEVDAVTDDVESVAGDLESVRSDVSNTDERVEDVVADVSDLEDQLERVDELADSVEAVESDLEDARDDIEALSEMREQLTSVFGAQMEEAGDE